MPKRERAEHRSYLKSREKCTGHYIRETVLARMVLRHIQSVMGYILAYRAHFVAVLARQFEVESTEKRKRSRHKLERSERRTSELKRLFIKIYEDNDKGKLSDEHFALCFV